ncbi:hypothetical protein [Pseudofrankia asymbiotica]|uniref:Uncharacterized protein n=1 Tax=Pseudofrankia asymbiotica TaxID=1834516 RepID=A0A1V2I8Y8_9ACTN|nr:hypothetical protein [Pseudofrankia asymbiotica]ONH27289.1 hypothetical protein BL253_22265 [Pseudofrankia asymbiotica]
MELGLAYTRPRTVPLPQGGAAPVGVPEGQQADRLNGDLTGGAVGYGDVVGLHLSQVDEADELLTNDPLALLIGMVLDQRVSEGWSGAGRFASA